jgi:acyl dehydratase
MPLGPLELPPVSRVTLANYAIASGDHAAVHLDPDYARQVGFPDVIAHGLLVMAYLGRVATSWPPARRLLEFSCRFMAVTNLGDELTCSGSVREVRESDGRRCADLDLRVVNQQGEVKIAGAATVELDPA